MENKKTVRLNKYLADQGICSRREAEKLITDGAIKVNGKVITEQGVKVDPENDKVEVSKIALDKKEKEIVVYALNKPCGYVCSTHKTAIEKDIVLDLFPKDFPRIYSVGRLDKDTSGLLIMTNDGDLTFRLTHPSFEHNKKYLVETEAMIPDGSLGKLKKGVNLFGQKTMPAKIKRISPTQFIIEIHEGKNRQIRRICRKVGANVKNLKRIQIGKLFLDDLNIKEGDYKMLTKEQVKMLLEKD